MRSFLLAASVGAAESLAVDAHYKSKKPAVQALMESATNMLKDGATPQVVRFTEETLEEISAIVQPAIIEESVNDQRFLDNLYSQFREVTSTLSTSNQEIHQLNREEQALSEAHQRCRDDEAVSCTTKRTCEIELYRLWTEWVVKEEELQEIHARIDGHFCPEGTNGTTNTFRVTATDQMHEYMICKGEVDDREREFDLYLPQCRAAHSWLDRNSTECNLQMTTLEEKACQHQQKITEVLATYHDDYNQALSTYNCATEEIMQLENDRKREWATLQVVKCLLTRIHEQNGAPCNSTGQVTAEIGHCEALHGSAHVRFDEDGTATGYEQEYHVCNGTGGDRRLCLNYENPPDHPPFCPARDQVVGACLPVAQPVPCDGHWHDQQIAVLPAVPSAPFDQENPGCNSYPQCTACDVIEAPPPRSYDSCPGYTVDGCARDGEEGEHPLTYVRDVDGVADVRCCSIDGETCQSRGFEGGVAYTTPGGGTHMGCYFQVTYQEAMTVCHAAGMRMCTSDEIESCCNTGCWHNHHAIWVDVAPGDRQD